MHIKCTIAVDSSREEGTAASEDSYYLLANELAVSMFRCDDDAIADYVESPHLRGGDTQGCGATGVRKCVLNLGWRMRDPVAVVSTIIAVIETVQIGRTSVDREKG